MCHLCGNPGHIHHDSGSGGSGSGPQGAKPVLTLQEVIDQIDSGAEWYTGGSTASTITYGVTTSRSWFPSNYSEYSGWSALNTKQAAAAHLAIELWDDLIATDIVQSSNPNDADIRFSNSSTGVSYAHAYYPGQTGTDTYSWEKAQGSIWFNSGYGSLTDPDVSEYGFMAFIHEIGHTLGLSHPGTYNGGSPTYANDALYEQDTHMYTVMSYFDAENTGADWYGSDGWWNYAQTPMLHDIATIQAIYGADMTTRSGDTTYGFNSTAGNWVFDFTQNDDPVLTIWDGGGTDTLDLSGWNTSSTISLVAGSFSHANAMSHNIAIAHGAAIENAIGGGGNDAITGNDLANLLRGLGGADVLDGGAGDDWLDGGAGFDTLIGGSGNDTFIWDALDNLAALDGGSGTDTLRIEGGAVPLGFDLSDHGLEQADHIQLDPGAANWDTITERYIDGWQLQSRDTVNDDGSRSFVEWDLADAFSWSEYSQFWDTLGRLNKANETDDSGIFKEILWDLDSAEAWSRQITSQDLTDSIYWSTVTLRYDDLNRLYEQTGTHDDGHTWMTRWDVENTETWSRETTRYDTSNASFWSEHTTRFNAANQLFEQIGIEDNGHTWQTVWDIDDIESWSRTTTRWDMSGTASWSEYTIRVSDGGQTYEQFGIQDSGQEWHTYWDTANVQEWARQTVHQDTINNASWSQHTLYFDNSSRLYKQIGVLDSGDTWQVRWDLDNAEAWTRETIREDVNGSDAWTNYALHHDDQDRLYEQIGTYDDGRTWHTHWDVDESETWASKTHLYDSADNHAWSEQIFEYDQVGSLINHIVIDDLIT